MSQFDSALAPGSAPRKDKKYFTVSEARRALTLVKRVVADIRATNANRLGIHADMNAELATATPRRQEVLQAAFERESDRLETLIAELHRIGVDLKDSGRGLVDFPCLHEGREVSLCWEGGETTIDFWHELDAGYAGRRPVSELHDAQ